MDDELDFDNLTVGRAADDRTPAPIEGMPALPHGAYEQLVGLPPPAELTALPPAPAASTAPWSEVQAATANGAPVLGEPLAQVIDLSPVQDAPLAGQKEAIKEASTSSVQDAPVSHVDKVGPQSPDRINPATEPGKSAQVAPSAPLPRFKRAPTYPQTPQEVQAFKFNATMAGKSVKQLAAEYGVEARTIYAWCDDFGISRRDMERSSQAPQKKRITDSAQAVTAALLGTMGVENPQVVVKEAVLEARAEAKSAPPTDPGALPDPMATTLPQTVRDAAAMILSSPATDADALALLKDIERTSASSRSITDLSRLQTMLGRLLVMAMCRGRIGTWDGLADAAGGILRTIIYARRVEADMPPTQDPVSLRQEAARQMMQEISSVLNDEEQGILAGMLVTASDRLSQRRGDTCAPSPVQTVTASVAASAGPDPLGPGAPSAPGAPPAGAPVEFRDQRVETAAGEDRQSEAGARLEAAVASRERAPW